MISGEDVEDIAQGWVDEFSVDPYVLRARGMDSWFRLDDLIHNQPQDALLVFERVAEIELINWTFEGFAIGPVRAFLMLHGERFDKELSAIRSRNNAFDEMHQLATDGL
jgi:hypothetical protein